MKDGFLVRNSRNRGTVLNIEKFLLPRAILASGGDHVVIVLVGVTVLVVMVWCSSAVVRLSRPVVLMVVAVAMAMFVVVAMLIVML